MQVFATNYLEKLSDNRVDQNEKWNWKPENKEVEEIYACGANTSSHESTYAAETDNRSDSDRPNEGMYVA